MSAGEQRNGGQNRQPVRLALPRAVLRHRERAGIYCQPTVSVEFQKQSKRYVVRGVESGGATREIGHYVAFCGPTGEPLALLQPIQSLTANGSHAVVIAPSLVSVEVFRAQQTYELLIARHEPRGGEDGRRPRLSSQVVFRGTQGYLSLELWGKDREAAGRITPEFFNRSGERKEIPLRFVETVKAAVKGATSIDCRQAVLAAAPVSQ